MEYEWKLELDLEDQCGWATKRARARVLQKVKIFIWFHLIWKCNHRISDIIYGHGCTNKRVDLSVLNLPLRCYPHCNQRKNVHAYVCANLFISLWFISCCTAIFMKLLVPPVCGLLSIADVFFSLRKIKSNKKLRNAAKEIEEFCQKKSGMEFNNITLLRTNHLLNLNRTFKQKVNVIPMP